MCEYFLNLFNTYYEACHNVCHNACHNVCHREREGQHKEVFYTKLRNPAPNEIIHIIENQNPTYPLQKCIEYKLNLYGVITCTYCHQKEVYETSVIHVQDINDHILDVTTLYSQNITYQCKNCNYLVPSGYFHVIKMTNIERLK